MVVSLTFVTSLFRLYMASSKFFVLYCKSFMLVLSLNERDCNVFLFKKSINVK
jgi:hypothetical protein